MSEVNIDSCIVLADKISKLLVNNGLNLEKNYEKTSIITRNIWFRY